MSNESELDLGYKKVLDLRKAHDIEDNLLKKFNTRSLQVSKSNWKLNKKETDSLNKMDYIDKTMADDSASAEICKGTLSYAKDMRDQVLKKSLLEIKEQKGKFEKKFFNFYKIYDSKNLLMATDEGRELSEKKRSELNTLERKENSCMKKGKDVFSQNIFKYLHNFLFTANESILLDKLLIKRGNRDLTLKCLQNKITIDEFLTKKSKYNQN